MLLGAVFGYHIQNIFLAIILAILCHYFLDLFPHVEYNIDNITSGNWKKSLPDFLKVFLDFGIGILFIFLFSKNQPMIYICSLIAIVPDGFTLISYASKNKWLAKHDHIHGGIIHYLTKQKKFPLFWRIFTQVSSVIICLLWLR
ncbi:MAG: hypothetical protein EXS48_01500 [Candidatus Staskawiczbacteria bacterium]|nr:hypothetical protein [Candidatus Staskawiczbacteria bacterium]